jgi:phosphate transport system substrate-binding protein
MPIKPGFIILPALVVGLGFWGYNSFFGGESALAPPPTLSNGGAVTTPPPAPQAQLPTNTNQLAGLTASGSTTLNNLMVALAPYGIQWGATGSSAGITEVSQGRVSLGASSRPLKPDEVAMGLQQHEIGRDGIALVVPSNSPAPDQLTAAQAKDIFSGRVTNWSEVGGSNGSIRVFIALVVLLL